MSSHGTASNAGQRSEFVGAVTRAAVLVAEDLTPNLLDQWSRSGERIKEILLANINPTEPQPVDPPPPLLEDLNIQLLTLAAERFDANAFFSRDNREISFYDRGSNFANLVEWLVETPVLASRISERCITRYCSGADLVKEIGEGHDLQFADIAAAIMKQPHGPKSPAGILKTDGSWNVAKVFEWLVDFYWIGDGRRRGWSFNASRPGGCSFRKDDQFLSRDSA
ncbi:MAG: hypothetical protein AAB483_02485 [Patescibacteria group bacterium]